jgi:hypothetical protein
LSSWNADAGSAEVSTLRLPQDTECPTTEARHGCFAYRYAYTRSADSRAAGASGQDYLTLREDGRRLAFALCDGVSQSFSGELASRLLGDALVEWLWSLPSDGLTQDVASLERDLAARLATLTQEAQPLVTAVEVPASLPPVVREVLEQKRALGTESNFVAGLLDTTAEVALLTWCGDCRLRLWHGETELTGELGETFLTRERWSSRLGIVGQMHHARYPLDRVQRIAVYSDGLATLDGAPSLAMDNQALDAAITATRQTPASDDVSALEVAIGVTRRKS